MKNKLFDGMIGLIIFLSMISCLMGILWGVGDGPSVIISYWNTSVTLHGFGLYQHDSVAIAAQGIAQDYVTLIVAIPMLVLSWSKFKEFSLRGGLILLGTLGYFLYTYTSYVFLWMLNPMFIVYVMLMSLSFFAFVWAFMQFDIDRVSHAFLPKFPNKLIGFVQIALGVLLGGMWLSMIVSYVFSGIPPAGLDHYTTLVIQGLDLGFIVPLALLSGVWILQRKPMGFMLSAVVIFKGFLMGLAILAMLFAQHDAQVTVSLIQWIVFPLLTGAFAVCFWLMFNNMHKTIDIKVYRHALISTPQEEVTT